jgi:hypothetical protein
MKNNTSQIQYFDTIRDDLLASIYSHDYERSELILSTVLKEVKSSPTLLENSQKSLYQIVQITEEFKKALKQSTSYIGLKTFLKTRTRLETKKPARADYNTWKNSFGIDDASLKILFSTTINFQLSTGCSNYCKRCNEWALPGVRNHFSYNAVIEIAENLARENNKEYALYSASDPLDWQDNNSNITHLTKTLAEKGFTPAFGMLTKIPKGKEKLFRQLIQTGADISASVTSLNRERLQKIEEQLSKTIDKQHDTDDLLIPAGRDEDFCTIKSSITDSYGTEITPDGAFIVAPTFTSALNPTGQKRIPVDKNTEFFIRKMAGRQGLKFDYFKHLTVIDKQNNEYTLDHLLDSQIENLLLDTGEYEITQPGMISLKEYFDTFKPEAVNKRKAMLSSVKKRLKKAYSGDKLSIKLKEYEDQCDQTQVNKLKQKKLIYFLFSIKRYLKQNNNKRIIISHLRNDEMTSLQRSQTDLTNRDQIEKILQQSDSDTFQLYTQLIFMLLNNPDNTLIANLLN